MTSAPLIAILKTADLKDTVQECEIPLSHFPDMIEFRKVTETTNGSATVRQFFRIGITDKKAVYREGVSYRLQLEGV